MHTGRACPRSTGTGCPWRPPRAGRWRSGCRARSRALRTRPRRRPRSPRGAPGQCEPTSPSAFGPPRVDDHWSLYCEPGHSSRFGTWPTRQSTRSRGDRGFRPLRRHRRRDVRNIGNSPGKRQQPEILLHQGGSMRHYKANLRDIEFNLFEALELGPLLDSGSAGELDSATTREILAEVARFAQGPVAESFVAADREPPVFLPDQHTITVPDPIRATVQAIWDAEWWRLGVAPEIGGTAVSRTTVWAILEMIICANPALFFYYAGPAMADILYELGNEQQRALAQAAVENRWGATMVLTEPDAGSDVGAGRAKAIDQPDGSWHIEGVKRFISGGDLGDTVENILHLVLARPASARPGTKGLSLFVVPKHLFDWDTFEIVGRNGVFATGLEHKMGYKASPTCELTFGAHGIPAKGWLVGDNHDGIAQMFKVIENARMLVGIKSSGTLSTGYLNALDYAKTRIQGADMTQMLDKGAPRVPITRHPDVRRSLIMQKAYAEGLRAIYLYTAAHQDPVVAAAVSGADEDMATRVNDLLRPIIKGVGSERRTST